MKKIMIAYCQYGGGHLSAAKNLKEYIEKYYPDTEIFMFDTMRYINRVIDKVSEATYSKITKSLPWLWGKIYYHTQEPIFERFINLSNRLLSYKLNKIIKEYKPDIIISTHFFVSSMCSILKKKGNTDAKLATIITDYGDDPYNEWIKGHEYTDYIFVAHNEIKNKLIEKGVDENKVFATGIPISDKFLALYNKDSVLQSIGLSKDLKTVLFFGGGELGLGKSKTLKIFEILSKDFPNIQVIAIAGRNENLKKHFDKIVDNFNRNETIKVIGFTDKVAEYMYASDIVITKPGGLTSTESLVSNLPIIAINPIPGQESENAQFLEQNGAAIWLKKASDITYILNKLLNNNEIFLQMKNNILKIAKKNSTKDISEILFDSTLNKQHTS